MVSKSDRHERLYQNKIYLTSLKSQYYQISDGLKRSESRIDKRHLLVCSSETLQTVSMLGLKASLDCERGSPNRAVIEKKCSAQKGWDKCTLQGRYSFAFYSKMVSVDAALGCVNTV